MKSTVFVCAEVRDAIDQTEGGWAEGQAPELSGRSGSGPPRVDAFSAIEDPHTTVMLPLHICGKAKSCTIAILNFHTQAYSKSLSLFSPHIIYRSFMVVLIDILSTLAIC